MEKRGFSLIRTQKSIALKIIHVWLRNPAFFITQTSIYDFIIHNKTIKRTGFSVYKETDYLPIDKSTREAIF